VLAVSERSERQTGTAGARAISGSVLIAKFVSLCRELGTNFAI